MALRGGHDVRPLTTILFRQKKPRTLPWVRARVFVLPISCADDEAGHPPPPDTASLPYRILLDRLNEK